MEDTGRPSFRGGGGEKRLEIASGRDNCNNIKNNGNQTYAVTGWPRLELDSPPAPPVAETKAWGFQDPDTMRKKRIVRYKVYGVEGRVKASFRNGLRWIKNKCSKSSHGY